MEFYFFGNTVYYLFFTSVVSSRLINTEKNQAKKVSETHKTVKLNFCRTDFLDTRPQHCKNSNAESKP